MQLLLPSAKHGVMVEIPDHKARTKVWAEGALLVFGILIVLWGTLDALSRLPQPSVSEGVVRQAFAPAVLIDTH